MHTRLLASLIATRVHRLLARWVLPNAFSTALKAITIFGFEVFSVAWIAIDKSLRNAKAFGMERFSLRARHQSSGTRVKTHALGRSGRSGWQFAFCLMHMLYLGIDMWFGLRHVWNAMYILVVSGCTERV